MREPAPPITRVLGNKTTTTWQVKTQPCKKTFPHVISMTEFYCEISLYIFTETIKSPYVIVTAIKINKSTKKTSCFAIKTPNNELRRNTQPFLTTTQLLHNTWLTPDRSHYPRCSWGSLFHFPPPFVSTDLQERGNELLTWKHKA